MIKIRNEKESDYKVVEDIIRKAFYSLHVPEYDEHYLAHIMRGHEDLISELDFVLEPNSRVVGNVMYAEARLADESGAEKKVLTPGPVSIMPKYQGRGCGKMPMEYSFERAVSLGHDVIVTFGRPASYVSSGLKSCKKLNTCLEDRSFPAAMMARELVPGALDGRRWVYHDGPAMAISREETRLYDDNPGRMEKRHLPSQEEFHVTSHSFIK